MDKVLGLIPNLYYDVVGRALPGALCLGCFVYFFPPGFPFIVPVSPSALGDHKWEAFLAGAFVFGYMLTAVSGRIFDWSSNPRSITCKNCTRTASYSRIDRIGTKESAVADGLWKSSAEKVLFENLFVGLWVFAVLNVIALFSIWLNEKTFHDEPTRALLSLVATLLAYSAAIHRHKVLRLRMFQIERNLDVKAPPLIALPAGCPGLVEFGGAYAGPVSCPTLLAIEVPHVFEGIGRIIAAWRKWRRLRSAQRM